jgi:nitrite reductase/ring-hydroxylating ferredoxin subunit
VTIQRTSIRLCARSDLIDGAARGFDLEGRGSDTLFVVRRGDEVVGYRNECPHINGAPMAWRKDAYLNADSSRIVCHAHGAQFDIASGLCLLGPCVGRSLQQLAIHVDADGTVLLFP